jgi:hypothetical protein
MTGYDDILDDTAPRERTPGAVYGRWRVIGDGRETFVVTEPRPGAELYEIHVDGHGATSVADWISHLRPKSWILPGDLDDLAAAIEAAMRQASAR